MKYQILFFLGFALLFKSVAGSPNIVFILADDMGLGDVHFYGGSRCKVKTPNIDRLAHEGMAFTDAHTPSSVCTPTRYGILTGRYCWRTRLKEGVLWGCAPHLINPKRKTLASLFKKKGYRTACIGKWHLGMDLPTTNGKYPTCSARTAEELSNPKKCNIDWDGQIKNGPNVLGFDYFWGITGSLGMAPFVWIENDHFVGRGSMIKEIEKHIAPASPDFVKEEVLPTITHKAVEYILQQKESSAPFFLYLPLSSPHAPICPSRAFQGKSSIGPYGDFLLETDWAVGEVLHALKKIGKLDDTLIFFTADNGCSPIVRFKDPKQVIHFNYGKKEPIDPSGHYPSLDYRGAKADLYDGGHRVPFLVRWGGMISQGSTNTTPICLTDFFATFSELTAQSSSAEDSLSILPLLTGKGVPVLHEAIVHHSIRGMFSIRQGAWKLLVAPGSGGWSSPQPGKAPSGAPKIQLYNLANDPGEYENVQLEHPEVVQRLQAILERYKTQGRSVPEFLVLHNKSQEK